jgi:hypothetical protein
VEHCGDAESKSIMDKGLLSFNPTIGEALPFGLVSPFTDQHPSVPSTFQFVSISIDNSPLPNPPIVGSLVLLGYQELKDDEPSFHVVLDSLIHFSGDPNSLI